MTNTPPSSQKQLHVQDVHEVSFTAANDYKNYYTDVDLWVTLSGPSATYTVPAFWDGSNVFRVRLVATEPGQWSWSTGSSTGDTGLDNQTGTFQALDWTGSDKAENPNRRGFLRVSENGHTVEYADGTPFFYTGDTVWTALTKIYSWSSAAGEAGISFQDYFKTRREQGFNGVNIIACFPTDTISGIWHEKVQKKKVSETGRIPFTLTGDEPDYTRINPDYWQEQDCKFQFLSDNGIVPFLETVRRHEKWPYADSRQKDAFKYYVRYLWARYGCYNIIFSWLHWDYEEDVYPAWLKTLIPAYEYLKSKNGTGKMPYTNLRTVMTCGCSLDWWYKDAPFLLDLHNISNIWRNDGKHFYKMRDTFRTHPAMPGFNIEPYYPGWMTNNKHLNEEHSAQYHMYGWVLNGGFTGHAWGDVYYGGVADCDCRDGVTTSGTPQREALNQYKSGTVMQYLRKFILNPGHDYRLLQPASDTHLGPCAEGDWLVFAAAADASFGLGFITTGFDVTNLKNLLPNRQYKWDYWDVEKGNWTNSTLLTTDAEGCVDMPAVPDPVLNWAFRVKLAE